MRVGFCRDCRFFAFTLLTSGQCRRYAPRALTSAAERTDTVWPEVKTSDGCGEFSKGKIIDPTKEQK